MTTPPGRKKPGPPSRFPCKLIVYVSEATKGELEQLAADTERSLPEVVRSYIRIGLARELDRDEVE